VRIGIVGPYGFGERFAPLQVESFADFLQQGRLCTADTLVVEKAAPGSDSIAALAQLLHSGAVVYAPTQPEQLAEAMAQCDRVVIFQIGTGDKTSPVGRVLTALRGRVRIEIVPIRSWGKFEVEEGLFERRFTVCRDEIQHVPAVPAARPRKLGLAVAVATDPDDHGRVNLAVTAGQRQWVFTREAQGHSMEAHLGEAIQDVLLVLDREHCDLTIPPGMEGAARRLQQMGDLWFTIGRIITGDPPQQLLSTATQAVEWAYTIFEEAGMAHGRQALRERYRDWSHGIWSLPKAAIDRLKEQIP